MAVLGGSSAFTPAFASALAEAARDLPDLEIRLHGRSEERLAAVTRFCNRHLRARVVPHEYAWTTSVEEACRGADLVVNQMRVGGWAGRTRDEVFPLAFGLPGDETIGPGGLASAIRGVPVVLDAARRAAQAAPGAWFINMGNPMGILLAALQSVPGLRALGLCELPAHTLARASSLLGMEELEADYLGLNHQGWFIRLAKEGKDLLPSLFDRIDTERDSAFFKVDTAVMRELHALPLSYMRLYYHTEREVEKLEKRQGSRGDELDGLSARLYDWYGKTGDPDLPELLRERSLVWFEMALIPAMKALLGGGAETLYVSERNGNDLPWLPEEAIVEKRCVLDRDGTRMIPLGSEPQTSFVAFLEQVVRFEQAALEAALQPTREKAAAALKLHPLGIDDEKALNLARKVLP